MMNFKELLTKAKKIISKKDFSFIIDKKINSPENLKKLENIFLEKAEHKIGQQTYRGMNAVVSILWKSKGEKLIKKAKEKTSNFIREEFENNNFSIKSKYTSGSKIKPNSYEYFIIWKHEEEILNFANFKLDENQEPDEKTIKFLEGYDEFVKEIKKLIKITPNLDPGHKLFLL